MSDTAYPVLQHYGTNAQRLAFTPSPAAGTQPIYIWYETDTDKVFAYTTAWHQISAASSGSAISALTGDVTATGPGSVAATIANNAVTTAKILAANVTLARIANAAANDKLLGSGNSGSGASYAEIALGSGLTMTGTTLSASGGSGTVTTTGSPASGNLTKFSGATSVTNADLTGDVTTSGGVATTLKTAAKTRPIAFAIDGGGTALTTGVKADIYVPYACTITAVTMLADQSGSVVVDIWKDTYANYPPTIADTITASALPTITTATKSQDNTLTGWTTSVSAGDTLRFNINSATTITRLALTLTVTV